MALDSSITHSCGKIVFRDRQSALDSIVGAAKDKRVTRSKKKVKAVYFCRDCNGWHTTSKKKKLRTVGAKTDKLFALRPQKIGTLSIQDFTFKHKPTIDHGTTISKGADRSAPEGDRR